MNKDNKSIEGQEKEYSNSAPNKGKKYTQTEIEALDRIAEQIQNIEQLNEMDKDLAKQFGRPIGGIRKQIEDRKGWFFTEGDKARRSKGQKKTESKKEHEDEENKVKPSQG